MNYWWVNQNQTYRYEVPGGYMWSPKRNVKGGTNRAYDLMRTVVPGDIIFSFADTKIKAIGIATSHCYEYPKPSEFGEAGKYWELVGWRVDVDYRVIPDPLRPKDHIASLNKLLPSKYSPLQNNGNGNQVFYLYDISYELASHLALLMDRFVLDLVKGDVVLDLLESQNTSKNLLAWEDIVQDDLELDPLIPETTKEALVQSRRGQGKFRSELLKIENHCRVTKVDKREHLVASHTKPWRDSTNEERLDPENGFMLTPTIDHLFDRGFISFEASGALVVSSVAHTQSMERMGIFNHKEINVGTFSSGQRQYLDWHREFILLGRVD